MLDNLNVTDAYKRERMFEKAVVARIQQLHETGRQLAVLKRMYQSYALIIERIVDRHKAPKDVNEKDNPTSLKNPGLGKHVGDAASDGENESFRTPLTAKAIVKFERLKDRIELYALSEIQECLDEKESLVFLVRRAIHDTLCRYRTGRLTLPVELQSDHHETVRGGRKVDTDYDTPGQSDDSFHACQSDDRLLLDTNSRGSKCIHCKDLLGLLRSHHGPFIPVLGWIWGHQSYIGREFDVQVRHGGVHRTFQEEFS